MSSLQVFLSLNICKIFSHLFDELGVPPVVGVPRCHSDLCDVERLELSLHEGGGGVRVAPAVLAGAEAVLKVPERRNLLAFLFSLVVVEGSVF